MKMKKLNIRKFVILICFGIFIANFNFLSANFNLFSESNINQDLLFNPSNRDNEIVLIEIPMDLFKADETFGISWLPEDSLGILYYSTAPGGTEIDNYIPSGISGFGVNINDGSSIETCADDIGIGVGVYYCVIYNAVQEWTSAEFQLIIESSDAVSMNTPANGTVIEEQVPTFSWDTNPGVPYYFLILSDSPFSLTHDNEGNLVITGLNPIWSAITPNNSADYGSPDPSGNFSYDAPPLVNGIDYNWIVMNNYGNDPLLTSDVASTPFGFTYAAEITIEAPELISPENTTPGDTTIIDGDDYITFEWSDVEEAATYHIYLSEIIIESGSEVQYPVWNEVTTNNLIDFNASSILVDARYVWKVIASDEDGNSACSETFEFTYHIPVGTFKIFVNHEVEEDLIGIGFANVIIDPVEGSGDNIPLSVGQSGYEYKTLPLGEYILTASKEGYETNSETANLIVPGDTVYVPITLEYSTCFFYGSVVDTNGYLIENCEITAEKDDGEIRTNTTSNGNYSIAVIPGMWTITADKESYSLQSSIEYNIGLGENANLDDLVLVLNDKDVTGAVKNTSGVPLSCVTVTATKGDITRTKSTNSSGLYQFNGLELGEWSIYAQKNGYYSPDPTIVDITISSPSSMTLSDIILTPQANIVNGNANNSVIVLEDVEIRATPSAGNPVSTYTNEYGNYTLNLLSGNYELTAIFDNYTSQNTHQLNLSVGETVNGINFILLPDDSYIEGTVTSSGSGLSDVTVFAGDNQDITDNSGNYSIDVSPETYLVSATKSGYTSSEPQTISIGAGQTIQGINFVLNPNASVISGTILSSGNSIANAQITGFKVSNGSYIQGTNSDNDGNYELNLYSATYKIWAEKNGFICDEGDTLDITVGPGQTISNQNIELTPYEAYITGTTVTQSGNVLRNVSIDIEEVNNPENSYSTVSGVYGNFSLIVTPLVEYNIIGSKTGYSSDEATTEVPLELEQSFSTELTLSALSSSVNGYVKSYDYEGNLYPLGQVTIQAVQDTNTFQTTSASNGEFTLGISQGEYEITAYKNGYLQNTINLEINPGSTIDTTLFLEENFSTIQGTITDATIGNSIENAFISANLSSGGGGATYSNSSGFYILENILPGFYYTITITKENYEIEILTNIVIPAGATITKNAELTSLTSTLKVEVVNQNSNPLSNVTISAENDLTGVITSDVTNSDGFCQLTGLAGYVEYNISASKTNYVCDDTLITIEPNETLTLEFTMELTNASITGSVIDDESIGLGNVEVCAVSLDGFSGNTTTDPAGNFTLQNLNPNRDYVITLSLEDYTDVQPDTIPLYQASYDTTLIMIPNNKSITGVVVDQEGNTLENVDVTATSPTASSAGITNSDGQFSLQELAPYETYTVATDKYQQGWENTEVNFTIEVAQVNPLQDDLTMMLHTSKFVGTVTKDATGDPVQGAMITIQVENGNTYSGTSQPDGTYSINYLYEGYYDFTIVKQSYATKIIDSVYVAHRSETTQNIDLTYTDSIDISGYLIDTDNRPIDSTSINLFNQEQLLSDTTDSGGLFIFENVNPYTTTTIGSNLPSDDYDNADTLISVETENITNINLVIDIHSAKISGIIEDTTSNPISNAEVVLAFGDEIQNFITSENGHYEFSYLYEGNYELSATRPGYFAQSEMLDLEDFEILNYNFQLEPELGSISGIVKNSEETFLKNVIVTLCHNDEEFIDTTSAAGVFSISNLQELHNYSLTCSKLGYNDYSHPDSLTTDSTDVSITLDMIPNSVLGTVYDDGVEVGSSLITAKNLDGFSNETYSNEFGDFSITGLSGYYDIWAEVGDDLVSQFQGIGIENGQPICIDIELMQASHIIGEVYYNDNPKAGVIVYASNIMSGQVMSDVTDSNGKFDVPGITAGTYDISIILEGFTAEETFPQVEIDEGQTVELPRFNLSFLENSISGGVYENESKDGIANAKVKLFKNDEVIDSLVTTSNGSILFSNLEDGIYHVSVSHLGYEDIPDTIVSLSGGISDPSTVDFYLTQKLLTIFGLVKNTNSEPLQAAVVFAERNGNTYSDTTDAEGSYSIQVDSIGIYSIYAEKENYYISEISEIELTSDQNNCYLELILQPKPSKLTGEIWIINKSTDHPNTVHPTSATIILECPENDFEEEISLSQYEFDELSDGNYDLSINATYESINFNFQELDISVSIGDSVYRYNEFIYNPNAANVSGFIKMEDEALPSANIILKDSTNFPIDTTSTNQYGEYIFTDLEDGIYNLQIEAEYDNELFSHDILNISITDDTTIDYTFDYVLCSIEFTITEDGSTPIQNVSVKITSANFNTTIYTDSTGNCSTDSTLHTREYSILISKSTGSFGDYINPLSYTLTLDTLRCYSQEKQLPLQFDKSQIVSQSALDSIKISLHKGTYNDQVFLHYKDADNNEYEIEMTDENDTLLIFKIPPQLKSGDITFWFNSQSDTLGITFSNQSSPYIWTLTSEGMLSHDYSNITPNEALFAYNQETTFEANLWDDAGNCLNDSVDVSGSVFWSLSDSTIGEIEQIPDEKRLILFKAADNNGIGKIKAKVTLKEITIRLETEDIQVKDMHLANLLIDGPNEIQNNESCSFTVSAEGSSMYVDFFEFEPVDSIIGTLEKVQESILYNPDSNFVGQFDLEVWAFDPNDGTEVTAEKQITVYIKLDFPNSPDTLYSGEGCNLTLPEAMLSSGSAKLYLEKVQVSPMQETTVTSELMASVFDIRSTANFAKMPGIIFEFDEGIDLSGIFIAYWDVEKLEWVDASSNGNRKNYEYLQLDSIPCLGEYGVVAESKQLGIYDLKLLPNPFSPYDQIGKNMGLQIIFKISSKISRYPKITAKIYTLTGTLVRTIAENRPMLKGNYEAGEEFTLNWDGMTKNGKMARNGRYVIQIIAEDANHKEEIVKTIILIK